MRGGTTKIDRVFLSWKREEMGGNYWPSFLNKPSSFLLRGANFYNHAHQSLLLFIRVLSSLHFLPADLAPYFSRIGGLSKFKTLSSLICFRNGPSICFTFRSQWHVTNRHPISNKRWYFLSKILNPPSDDGCYYSRVIFSIDATFFYTNVQFLLFLAADIKAKKLVYDIAHVIKPHNTRPFLCTVARSRSQWAG